MASRRLKCLFRKHQWHNGWDAENHKTVWTCERCGVVRTERQIPKSLWGLGDSGGGPG